MSDYTVLAGPIKFVNKQDSREQRTQAITEKTDADGKKTYALHIRFYRDGREEKRATQIVEDLNTALIRFQTNSELYQVEGFENKGVGNATKGEAPKPNLIAPIILQNPQVLSQITTQIPLLQPVGLFGAVNQAAQHFSNFAGGLVKKV